MEHLETQASDLRFLTQAPVPISDAGSVSYETPRPGQHGSPRSASYGDNSAPAADSSNSKRKSTDDAGAGGKQTRSKRNRYISIACNECKRRKIKCNGETPCHRCGNLNLACLYTPNCCSNSFKDSEEYKTLSGQLGRLQDEVAWLSQSMRAIQSDVPRAISQTDRAVAGSGPALSNSESISALSGHQRHELNKSTGFRGPTSTAFMLDVANATISNMGYQSINPADDQDNIFNDAPLPVKESTHDPLLDFSGDEMIRLCQLHEEEVGIMYPVLDIQTVITHAKNISTYFDTIRHQQPRHAFNDEKTLQLKMVMCCALIVEEHGHSEKCQQLYDSMEAVVNRKLMSDASDVSSLPLLALLAGYRFLANDEILAWRVIGQVNRLCLELGIHQKDGLFAIKDESERKNALNSFWSAYVLDRRWAFGTGLPFTVQDDDVDPDLPLPEEFPYLVAMVTYSRIGAKVWRQVSHSGPVLARETKTEGINQLDKEILNWYETVPEEVKVRNWDELQLTSPPSYNLQRLRIWTYLRFHQIRIWLYTPILHSATSIMENPAHAQKVVELAKSTIQFLTNLNNSTDLYRRVQVFYHQFLASAIAVVFLASVHAPVRFSAVCREEFYMALELVRDLSAKSWVSKRLWRTIKSLKDVAPRFGLNPDDDAHSSAALGMIGLARGHSSAPVMGQNDFGSGTSQMTPAAASMENGEGQNGAKIQTELSRIFEGYVGLNGFHFNSVDAHGQAMGSASGQQPGPMYTANGTVYPQLREMF